MPIRIVRVQSAQPIFKTSKVELKLDKQKNLKNSLDDKHFICITKKKKMQ